jgi:hypothetical protein
LLSAVTGDFNKDGYADLAIGIPDQTVGAAADAGSVQILYGSKAGLSAVKRPGTAGLPTQVWTRTDLQGTASAGDRFGAALAVGDFNRDGYVDLAIGAPGQEVGGNDGAGAVYIM